MKRKFLLISGSLYSLAISAQTPIGSEFMLNTFTNAGQFASELDHDANGNFVATWISDDQDTPGGRGIFAQRFDSTGAPIGQEFQVNTYVQDNQEYPDVAMAPDGRFVIAWNSTGQDAGGDQSIHFQLYDANGTAVGGETMANVGQFFNQSNPEVAMDANGNFAIVWVTYDPSVWDEVVLRVFDSTGTPITSDIIVNQFDQDRQMHMNLEMAPSGDIVVVWASDNQDGDGTGVMARRFDLQGNPLSNEFLVNSYTGGNQERPAVSVAPDGSFVIAWQSEHQDGSSWGIYHQRFDNQGVALGAETHVNTNYISDGQAWPAISCDSLGNYAICWESFGQDGSHNATVVRQYYMTGNPAGTEFIANTYTQDWQHQPSISMAPDGTFVVAWESYSQVGNNNDIFAQMFSASTSLSATTIEGLPDAIIYPNPTVDGTFMVDFGEYIDQASLRVLSLDGRLIHTEQVSGNQVRIAIPELPAGVYQVQLVSPSKHAVFSLVSR